jgi:hypothetical protein
MAKIGHGESWEGHSGVEVEEYIKGAISEVSRQVKPMVHYEEVGDAAVITAPDQVVLRSGDKNDPNAGMPYVRVVGDIDEATMASADEKAYVMVTGEEVLFRAGDREARLAEMVPAVISREKMKEMEAAGLWYDYCKGNPLIYVTEE